jgi:beta-fructofuranosidase
MIVFKLKKYSVKHFVFILISIFSLSISGLSQENPKPESSLVNAGKPIPKEVIKATREFRERLLADPFRPAYHFSFPEDNGMPGDPNGAFYHNGRYHLMFLYNSTGKGFVWGHASSADLLHWRPHPDAIVMRVALVGEDL